MTYDEWKLQSPYDAHPHPDDAPAHEDGECFDEDGCRCSEHELRRRLCRVCGWAAQGGAYCRVHVPA